MKIQFQILLFLVCLNLGIGLVFTLGLPGTEYVGGGMPENPAQSPGNYESHFNATDMAGKWSANPLQGVPIIGDIYSAFQFFVVNWRFLIDGFPTFITWVGDMLIVDAGAKWAFIIFANVLRAIYAILMFVFFVEFIGGRYFTS